MGERGEETLVINLEDNSSAVAKGAATNIRALADAYDELEAARVNPKPIKEALWVMRNEASKTAQEIEKLKRASAGAGSGAEAAIKKLAGPKASPVPGRAADSFFKRLAAGDSGASASIKPMLQHDGIIRRNILSLRELRSSARSAFDVFRTGKISGGWLSGLKQSLTEAGPILTKLAAVALAAVGAIGYGMGKLLSVQAAKEDTKEALNTILKSSSESEKVFARAVRTADFLRTERQGIAQTFVEFIPRGFKPAAIDELIRRMYDLKTISPKTNLEGIQRALSQISATGYLQGDELQQLNEAGVASRSIYEALAKQLGKTIPEVQKLQAARKLSADAVFAAFLEAAKQTTGGKAAGEVAAARARQNLSGLMEQIKGLPSNVLFDVDAGPGITQVKSFLNDVIDFFSAGSETGKLARDTIADVFNSIVEGLLGKDLSKGGTKEALVDLFQGIRDSKDGIKEFASGVATIAGALVWVVGLFGKVSSAQSSASESLGLFGRILKLIYLPAGVMNGWKEWRNLFSGDFSLFTGDAGIGAWIGGIVGKIKGAAVELWNAGAELGKNIISGFAGAISGGAASVANAAIGMAKSALGGAAGPQGIDAHSPSKKSEQLAVWFDEGFANYLRGPANDNARDAAGEYGAAAANAPAPAMRAADARGPSASSVGGAGAVTIHVTVQAGAGMTTAQAEQIGEAVGQASYKAWRRNMSQFLRDATTEAA